MSNLHCVTDSDNALKLKISFATSRETNKDLESSTPTEVTTRNLFIVLNELHQQLVRRDPRRIFAEPVTDEIAVGYSKLISHPMDLGTIYTRLHSRTHYHSVTQYLADVTLMCNNAMIYNPPDTIYYQRARKLLSFCRKQICPSALQKLCRELNINSLTSEELGDISPPEWPRQHSTRLVSCTLASPTPSSLSYGTNETKQTSSNHKLPIQSSPESQLSEHLSKQTPSPRMSSTIGSDLVHHSPNLGVKSDSVESPTIPQLSLDGSPLSSKSCTFMEDMVGEESVRVSQHPENAEVSLNEKLEEKESIQIMLDDEKHDQEEIPIVGPEQQQQPEIKRRGRGRPRKIKRPLPDHLSISVHPPDLPVATVPSIAEQPSPSSPKSVTRRQSYSSPIANSSTLQTLDNSSTCTAPECSPSSRFSSVSETYVQSKLVEPDYKRVRKDSSIADHAESNRSNLTSPPTSPASHDSSKGSNPPRRLIAECPSSPISTIRKTPKRDPNSNLTFVPKPKRGRPKGSTTKRGRPPNSLKLLGSITSRPKLPKSDSSFSSPEKMPSIRRPPGRPRLSRESVTNPTIELKRIESVESEESNDSTDLNEILISARQAAVDASLKLQQKYASKFQGLSAEPVGPHVVCLDVSQPGLVQASDCPKARSTMSGTTVPSTLVSNDTDLYSDKLPDSSSFTRPVLYPAALVHALTGAKPNPKKDEQELADFTNAMTELNKLKYNPDEPISAAIHGPLAIFTSTQLAQLGDVYGGGSIDPSVIEYAMSLLTFTEPIGRWARRWATKKLDIATDGLHSQLIYATQNVNPTDPDNTQSTEDVGNDSDKCWLDTANLTMDPPTPPSIPSPKILGSILSVPEPIESTDPTKKVEQPVEFVHPNIAAPCSTTELTAGIIKPEEFPIGNLILNPTSSQESKTNLSITVSTNTETNPIDRVVVSALTEPVVECLPTGTASNLIPNLNNVSICASEVLVPVTSITTTTPSTTNALLVTSSTLPNLSIPNLIQTVESSDLSDQPHSENSTDKAVDKLETNHNHRSDFSNSLSVLKSALSATTTTYPLANRHDQLALVQPTSSSVSEQSGQSEMPTTDPSSKEFSSGHGIQTTTSLQSPKSELDQPSESRQFEEAKTDIVSHDCVETLSAEYEQNIPVAQPDSCLPESEFEQCEEGDRITADIVNDSVSPDAVVARTELQYDSNPVREGQVWDSGNVRLSLTEGNPATEQIPTVDNELVCQGTPKENTDSFDLSSLLGSDDHKTCDESFLSEPSPRHVNQSSPLSDALDCQVPQGGPTKTEFDSPIVKIESTTDPHDLTGMNTTDESLTDTEEASSDHESEQKILEMSQSDCPIDASELHPIPNESGSLDMSSSFDTDDKSITDSSLLLTQNDEIESGEIMESSDGVIPTESQSGDCDKDTDIESSDLPQENLDEVEEND